jgi:hypothetical protein
MDKIIELVKEWFSGLLKWNERLASTLKIDMIYCKISIRGKRYGKYKCRKIVKKTGKIEILVMPKNEYYK